jgi:hypothetical protein
MPVSGIAAEGVLPDVDSRAHAAAGEEGAKENWVGEKESSRRSQQGVSSII